MRSRLALLAAIAFQSWATEGKWTPQQVLELDPAWLRAEGLQLPPARLWDREKGSGLLAATVNIPGCSAAFVSPDGLIVTNHHCLFSVMQEHSTPANDIIKNGFLARTRDGELRGKLTKVAVPYRFTDVTDRILASIPPGSDDAARSQAVDRKSKELVSNCEARPGARCRVAVFDGGLQYQLIDTTELGDVRLVYAPPRAIGEFGGEVDNWMWPRHTGDFSIARVYDKGGQPYHPEHWLRVSTEGVRPGSFVMVMGYPGTTYRSMLADEMSELRDLQYPHVIEVIGEFIRIMESTTAGNHAGEIAVAANLKSLHNVYKNAQGQLAGFQRGRLLEKQKALEDVVAPWATARPEFAGAAKARDELAAVTAAARPYWERNYLLNVIASGSKALFLSTQIVRAAIERTKPDAVRETQYQERERTRLRDRIEREQKNYFEPADKALLTYWLNRWNALTAVKKLPALPVEAYANTKLFNLDERLKMFEETPEQLRARHDPILDLAFLLAGELEAQRKRKEQRDGSIARLRPEWRKAVIAHAGKPLAPDANLTLRVTFGHVEGYSPRDGILYQPQTTLAGLLEKGSNVEPFIVPEAVLAAARSTDATKVPVNFLADADTTGGNSGSPVVNGKGELVGVNFDRVWENVANDFGYNPDVARNVSVDTRFLLWMLAHTVDGSALIKELTGK